MRTWFLFNDVVNECKIQPKYYFPKTTLKIASSVNGHFPNLIIKMERVSAFQRREVHHSDIQKSKTFRTDFKWALRWAPETKLVQPSTKFLNLSFPLTD